MLAANPKALLNAGGGHIFPATVPATTGYGAGVDRKGYDWAYIVLKCGAPTGAPTSFSATVQVQDDDLGDAGGSAGADYTDISGATAAVTAANSSVVLEVDLRGADRFLRLEAVIAFVGGAGPTLPVDATLCLFNKNQAPAVAVS